MRKSRANGGGHELPASLNLSMLNFIKSKIFSFAKILSRIFFGAKYRKRKIYQVRRIIHPFNLELNWVLPTARHNQGTGHSFMPILTVRNHTFEGPLVFSAVKSKNITITLKWVAHQQKMFIKPI